ncbi:MAG: hypothetical protein CVT68_04530 [Actinobacteria bacterium HGW-Actinobacteria-8]|nr:MAG: hypothetical protein CVT68_04530 [Actinobacteria bacterium HGW-Actinobacteria-8]
MTVVAPPFTSAQIRDACPDGHTLDILTTRDGEVVDRRRTVYFDPDESAVSIRVTALDAHGETVGESMEARSTWDDLRDHAVFRGEVTTVTRETIETPLGRLECARYDVASGEVTLVFWFSGEHPGMPMRYATVSDGHEVETTEVTAVMDPTS